MRKKLIAGLFIFLLTSTFAVPAYANSAQTHWRGKGHPGKECMVRPIGYQAAICGFYLL